MQNCLEAPETRRIGSENDRVSEKHRVLIRRVVDYVQSEKGVFMDRDEAARMACMSSSYFSRIFSHVMGESYSDFVLPYLKARVEKLLMDPLLSIKYIAGAVGFKSANYFSSWCREVFGMTPSSYRSYLLGLSTES